MALAVLIFLPVLFLQSAAGAPFQDGHRHYFTYYSKAYVFGLHNLTTVIKFHITPVNQTNDGRMNLLRVDSFVQHSDQGYVQDNPDHWDLTRNFLFLMSETGVVNRIYHHQDEIHEVLTLKKMLSGTMSMYNKGSRKSRWKYSEWETDQHGKLRHTYTGTRHATGSTVTRKHNSTAETNMVHEKTVEYDDNGLIQHIKSTETVLLRGQPSGPQSTQNTDDAIIVTSQSKEFPSLSSTANNVVKLTARKRIQLTETFVVENYKQDTSQIRKRPLKERELKDAQSDLDYLLKCINSHADKFAGNRTVCVQDLFKLYDNITNEARLTLGHKYLARCQVKDNICEENRLLFMDIISGRGDRDAQKLMVKYVLNDRNSSEEDYRRTLFQYAHLKEPIQETVSAIIRLCFDGNSEYTPTIEMSPTQRRACLSLGAMAKSLATNGNKTLSEDILDKLETKLGLYDHPTSSPILSRRKRSVEDFDPEQHYHIESKMVLLHSLGNAGMPRSLRHIRSYLQPNTGSVSWRRAAADSLRHYKCNESALALFDILAHEQNKKVHALAHKVYSEHPLRKELVQDKENLLLSRDYSFHALTRVRREVFHIDFKDGIHIRIQVPGIKWDRTYGSSKIGASLGLHIVNWMDMKLHPLHSAFAIDIDNQGFVIANLGIINKHFDVIRVGVCFSGHIQYNLNVLKDFSISHFQDLLDKFKTLYDGIVGGVKGAVAMFKKIIQPGYLKGILTAIINFVKDLPHMVVQFVEDFVNLVKKIVHYHTDHFIEMVKQTIQKVKAFAEEILQDAIAFYHRLADPVMVTLPNVGKLLKDAGDDIIHIFKDFFKSPVQSFSMIGQTILKVRMAIGMVIDAKNQIVDACSFKKGIGPFWMKISDGVRDIIEDFKEFVGNVVTKVGDLFHPRRGNGTFISAVNGITGPYKIKSWFKTEVGVLLKPVLDPLTKLINMTSPFFKAYQDVMAVVKGVREAYETIKTVISDGKSMIQKVFGSKFHKKFPSVRDASECTEAVWPSDAHGKYSTTGVDVTVSAGNTIVNPVAGVVKKTGDDEITIVPTDDHFSEYEVIIQSVTPNMEVTEEGMAIEAGEPIGTAHDVGCSLNFIHVALRVIESGEFADPSKYLDRLIPTPHWVQECNSHGFKVLGVSIDVRRIKEGAKKAIEDFKSKPFATMGKKMIAKEFTVDRHQAFKPQPPAQNKANVQKMAGGFRGMLSPLKKFGNFLGSFKFPKLSDVFNINTITVEKLLKLLKGSPDLVHRIEKFLKEVQKCMEDEPTDNVFKLSSFKLRNLLAALKLPRLSNKLFMIKSLLTKRAKVCPNLNSTMDTTSGHIFYPDKDCQGLRCGLVFKSSHTSVHVKILLRECNGTVTVDVHGKVSSQNVADRTKIIDVPLSGSGLDGMHVQLQVKTELQGVYTSVTMDGRLCTDDFASCLPPVPVLSDALFHSPDCNQKGHKTRRLLMTVKQLISRIAQCGLAINDAVKLLNDVRTAVVHVLFEGGNSLRSVLDTEFKDKSDKCIRKPIPIKPFQQTFFDVTYPFMIGPIPMSLGFGSGGQIGASFEIDFCFMSMTLKGVLTPHAGLSVWGSLNIDIGFAYGGIKLTGYILTTSFPITATIGFSKFPLPVTAKMDMEMVPLAWTLEAYAKLRLIFVTVTVWRGTIWHYSTPAIRKNIFTIPHKGSDSSPPEFKQNSMGHRTKRSAGPAGCLVTQIKGRHPTDTAFILKATSEDDVSDVKMHYGIGTYSGGVNVVRWTEMAGITLTVPQKLPNGVPLYWTLKASNSEGAEAVTTCQLHTYDNTPPDGRVDEDYRMSSNPFELAGTAVVIEDSPVDPQQNIALGLSSGSHGNEIASWDPIVLERTSLRHSVSSYLKYFSHPKPGHLTAKPMKSIKTFFDYECAKACVDFGQNCVSFDFNYNSQTCDFHNVGEGPRAALEANRDYKSFERLGVGYKHYKVFKNLNLTHRETYFMNTHVKNSLGYESFLTSHGTLIDLSPPSPGDIGQALKDEIVDDGCTASILQRCKIISKLPNHRKIIDGSGGSTVFSGHKKGVEEKYTLSNNLIAGNWDGFHDNETGIYGYTWAAGTSVCSNDIVDFNDPHANLASRDDWTNSGLQSGLHLDDGHYYITAQAINNIVHGGALVTTVCHSSPLTVDTSPPIFSGVQDVFYDEDFDLLGIYYNGSDPLSDIARVDFGLGLTKNDVKVRSYDRVNRFGGTKPYILIEDFHLKEGVAAWPRIRLTNNVQLSTSGHADEPIIVDSSPPVAGIVRDGDVYNTDLTYQAKRDTICAQWEKFYDEESGIDRYLWAVGTRLGQDDTVKFQTFDRTVHEKCAAVNLTHNTTYFSTVVAFNGALNMKRVNTTSNGVLVDMTDPIKGWIKDGPNRKEDMKYSSSEALIEAVWDGFSDPESKIAKYEVDIYVEGQLRKTNTYTSGELEMHEKTIGLKQGYRVYCKIRAFNGAGKSVEAITDGFTLDLTPPLAYYVHDNSGQAVYQSSKTRLDLSWKFRDDESGLDKYMVSVFKEEHGQKGKIWPVSKSDEEIKVMTNAMNYTLKNLNLVDGAKYTAHVIAVNKAQMSRTVDSPGVIVDSTPPSLDMIHVGPEKEDEEIENGKIMYTDETKITVSWSAIDPESGIKKVKIAVGTSATDQSITNGFFSFPDLKEVTLRNLNLVNTDKSGKYYFIQMQVENGAGILSAVEVTKPIKVLPGDVPGIIYDGSKRFVDSDFTRDKSTVSMSFAGFQSVACGITGFDWGIGTEPFVTDIVQFTSFGIVKTNDSSGFGQMNIQLFEGVKYFSTVRAKTGHLCRQEEYIVATSDGITVDTEGPTIKATNSKGHIIPDIKSWGLIFQNATDIIEVVPHVTDPSGVNKTTVCLGTYPYRDNIHKCSTQGEPDVKGLSLSSGASVFITITSLDNAQNNATWESLAIIPDRTPPELQNLACTPIISTKRTEVECSWLMTKEYESHVTSIKVCMGTASSTCSLIPTEVISLQSRVWYTDVFKNISHVKEEKVFVTFWAKNAMNKETIVTREIRIDRTEPTFGNVFIVTNDHLNASFTTKPCQTTKTYVEVLIRGFKDRESSIERCDVGLGRQPGSTDIHPFSHGKQNKVLFFGNLALKDEDRIYAVAQCTNKAGLSSTVTSDPVILSQHATLRVADGSGTNDQDFQTELSTLQGQWYYSTSCPVVKVEWQILTADWKVFKKFASVSVSGGTFFNDELHLGAGYTYINIIRTTDAIGRVRLAHTDGITVLIDPPHPGKVRDGLRKDIDYQTSTTELAVNWDPFGNVNSTDATQQIQRYEVAVGDDVRNPSSRYNILFFENARLSSSYVFKNLTLTPKRITYFVTVRAYSKAGSFQESFSDGIKVGFDMTISPGSVDLRPFISSTQKLDVSWRGFYSDIGIQMYTVGVSEFNLTLTKNTTDCTDVMADLHARNISLTSTGKTTSHLFTNLNLQQGHTYFAVVVAHDNSDSCLGVVQGPVTVDITPPMQGYISPDGGHSAKIAFVNSTNVINLAWGGFKDHESGIFGYHIVLQARRPCSNDSIKTVKTMDVSNGTRLTLYNLNLMTDLIYVFNITALNHAGLSISARTEPILIDPSGPLPGSVKVGSNWEKSRSFQHALDSTTVVVALAQTSNATKCTRTKQVFPSTSGQPTWFPLETSGKSNSSVLIEQGYARVAVTYDHKLRNVTTGALTLNVGDVLTEGNYTFKLKCAEGQNIITSIHIDFSKKSEYIHPVLTSMAPLDKDGVNPLQNETMYATNKTANECLAEPGLAVFLYGYKGNDTWTGRMCVKDENKQTETWFSLPGDPSAYMYEVTFGFIKNAEEVTATWKTTLFIQGHRKADVQGYVFSAQPKIIFQVDNLENYKPPILDPLHPFFSQAVLSFFGVPNTKDQLCLHGSPFYDEESSIKEFWFGIGSNKTELDNVVPFRLVSSFCLPCKFLCNELCNSNCSVDLHSSMNLVKINLQNLNLESSATSKGNSPNSTQALTFKAPTYYINVKAVNFANIATIVKSSSFQVDITPPTIEYVMCVDPTHSLDEPTEFVGSNKSIGAFWKCEEDVSEIAEYTIEVGTTEYGNDLLKETSVGMKKKVGVTLKHAAMTDGVVYYLTVTAVNSAGLKSKAFCNVTAKLSAPTISNVYIEKYLFTSANVKSQVFLSEFNKKIGMAIHGGLDIIYYEWKLGTISGTDDVFPLIKIGTRGEHARISIEAGKLRLNDKSTNISLADYNITHTVNRTTTSDGTFMLLEPGRCYYHSLKAVGQSHISVDATTQPVCIKRTTDTLVKLNGRKEWLDIDWKVHINKTAGTPKPGSHVVKFNIEGYNGSVLVGTLNQTDLSSIYGSAATAEYVPYLVDPAETMDSTSRILHGRPIKPLGTSFFVSPATQAYVKPQLDVITAQSSYINRSIVLLQWNRFDQRWEVADENCKSQGSPTTSSMQKVCVPGNEVNVNGTDYIELTEPVLLSLFEINKEVQNTAPQFLTSQLELNEDQQVLQYIKVYDAEGDYLEFSLKTNAHDGFASVAADGYLTYSPHPDFCGQDNFTVVAKERSVPRGATQYSTEQTIQVEVLCMEDAPELKFISASDDIYDAATDDTVTIELPPSSSSRFIGNFILSDSDTDILDLIYDQAAASDVHLEIKNASDLSSKYRNLKKKSNKMFDVWITDSANTHANKTIKFRAKDGKLIHSNLISLQVSLTRTKCSGAQCNAIKTAGLKRDKAKVFAAHHQASQMRTPPPQLFKPDFLGKGSVQLGSEKTTGRKVVLDKEGIFSLTTNQANAKEQEVIIKAVGKLNISASKELTVDEVNTNVDRIYRGRLTPLGLPLTISLTEGDIKTSRVEVKVKREVQNDTDTTLFYKDSNGVWTMLNTKCNATKTEVLQNDQDIVHVCPQSFASMANSSLDKNKRLSVEVALFSLKKTLVNTPPKLSQTVIFIKENEQYYEPIKIQDAEGDKLTFELIKDASHGTADLDSEGNFYYYPAQHFNGEDQIRMKVSETGLTNIKPNVKEYTLKINVTNVNDLPMMYMYPPNGVQYKVFTNSKFRLDIVHAVPYLSPEVDLGYVVSADWDVGDDCSVQLEPLQKNRHYITSTKWSITDQDLSPKLSAIRLVPTKNAYKLTLHLLSEFKDTVSYMLKIKDKAGAKIDLELDVSISFKFCSASAGCPDEIKANIAKRH